MIQNKTYLKENSIKNHHKTLLNLLPILSYKIIVNLISIDPMTFKIMGA